VSIRISEAIAQLRDELREAILESDDKDILFVPQEIEIELGLEYEVGAAGKGGFKVLTLFDFSTDAKATRKSDHKVRLKLSVTDDKLEPIRIRSRQQTDR
jgi:Trypsin-co-occurring domain 2